MTVYVDDMAASFGRMKMCHMIADSEDELHAMADRIGVARKWYQGDHYDVALSKRALAIAAGAVPVTLRELGLMSAVRRRNPNVALCAPEDAHRLFMERLKRPVEIAAPHGDGS